MKRIVFLAIIIALLAGVGFLMFHQPAPPTHKIEKTLTYDQTPKQ